MPSDAQLSDSFRGYLSEEAKRRFTLVTGILGAVFFLAQILLPVLLVFLIMMPAVMLGEFPSADFARAALWHGDLWFLERIHRGDFTHSGKSRTRLRLRHARLDDLALAPESVDLDTSEDTWTVALLPQADRLWIIGSQELAFYEGGALTKVQGPATPRRASRPFIYQGAPAVVTLGHAARLVRLQIHGAIAEWQSEPIALDAPLAEEDDVLQEVRALPVGDRLYLLAVVCGEAGETRRLYYREMTQAEWRPLSVGGDSCSDWNPVAVGDHVAVASLTGRRGGEARLSIMTVATDGATQREELGPLPGHVGRGNWGILSADRALFLVSEAEPDGRNLIEISDGKVVRSVRKGGAFPFGGGMTALMIVPQLLPGLLSLALALILTLQMRKHRIRVYAARGAQRAFATLWQRAWAQVVDAVVVGAGFIPAGAWMWRMVSDPEQMLGNSARLFPFVFFGLIAFAFVWMLAVLAVFSYFEGRSGKTPGKWLLHIRVVGTDLAPCGFGRALVRNLLTFVDGFFNFLIGVLLVALTENWQRLGDLAARTLVVTDEKAPALTEPAQVE